MTLAELRRRQFVDGLHAGLGKPALSAVSMALKRTHLYSKSSPVLKTPTILLIKVPVGAWRVASDRSLRTPVP